MSSYPAGASRETKPRSRWRSSSAPSCWSHHPPPRMAFSYHSNVIPSPLSNSHPKLMCEVIHTEPVPFAGRPKIEGSRVKNGWLRATLGDFRDVLGISASPRVNGGAVTNHPTTLTGSEAVSHPIERDCERNSTSCPDGCPFPGTTFLWSLSCTVVHFSHPRWVTLRLAKSGCASGWNPV